MGFKQIIKVRVQSYDEGIDMFKIEGFGFTQEDEVADPVYCKGAPDFDDFSMPGALVPMLLGEYGEPSDLVGRVFELTAP